MVRKIEQIWKGIPDPVKFAFKATMVLGIIIHLFMITNKLPNHDDLGQIFDNMERSTSGRWFLRWPAAISGDYSIAFAGVLGITYISIGVAVLTYVLNIKSKIIVAAMGGAMVSFPTIAGTMFYMNSADSYFFGLMLATIAVYFTMKKERCAWILAVLCLTLSLGIYQAYVPFAIGILIILHIAMLLSDKVTSIEILKNGMKSIGILGVSVVLYFIKVKYDQLYGGIELTTYKGIDQMGKISFNELPDLIVKAYTEPLRFFGRNSMKMHYEFVPYLFVTVLSGAVIFAFYLLSKTKWNKKEKRIRVLLMAVLLFVLPLGAGMIYIMVTARIHLLMVYGFVALLILPLVLVDRLQDVSVAERNGFIKKVTMLLETITLCMAGVLIMNYAVISNQAYFQMNQAYEQSFAYSTRLVSRIEQTEGFTKDKTIIMLGKPNLNTDETMRYIVEERIGQEEIIGEPLKEQLKMLTGLNDTYVDVASYRKFLKHYIGVEQEIIAISDRSQLEELGVEIETLNLTNYPENQSIMVVDDKVIVKFSEL